MNFLIGVLIGLGVGIPVFFICLGIYLLFKNTLKRREVKKMIANNQFLTPIDPKDYDTNAWKDNINPTNQAEDLKNFNEKIFNKENEDGSIKEN